MDLVEDGRLAVHLAEALFREVLPAFVDQLDRARQLSRACAGSVGRMGTPTPTLGGDLRTPRQYQENTEPGHANSSHPRERAVRLPD